MSYTKTNGTDFQSSNIDSIAYDDAAQTLEVAFISGGKRYRYKDVDANTAEQMATAESKTKFLNESVKNRFEVEAL